jgi:hypothetical protein
MSYGSNVVVTLASLRGENMNQGIPGDVNNSIFQTNAYPLGRNYGSLPASATSFDMRNNMVGELGGLNQDYRGVATARATMPTSRNGATMRRNGNGNGNKPALWWVTFAIIFIVIAWAARKFAPDGEQFAIIKPNLINWLFITLTVILTMVFLKQIALRVKRVPFLSPVADLIISV